MKIGFNSLPLKTGHLTRGIGFYTKNLISALKNIPNTEIQEFSRLSEVRDVDIVHYPFFDLFQATLPLKKVFPTVVTIHDVIPLIFSKNYPIGLRGIIVNTIQRFSLKGVKAVITDSQASKTDIAKYLKVPLKNIFPIYLAPADHFKPITDKVSLREIKGKYSLPEKYAVFIGDVNWNKNLLNIAGSCKKAGIDLVLIGGGFTQRDHLDHPELKSLKIFLENYGNDSHFHILGFVPDEDMAAIISQAQVTLLVSFYEGFGLPILESQACGTPVITSNNSSMIEVSGESAVTVDPYDINAISEGIKSLVGNTKLRNEFIKKGFENVKKFSWEKVARDTVKVYETILFR